MWSQDLRLLPLSVAHKGFTSIPAASRILSLEGRMFGCFMGDLLLAAQSDGSKRARQSPAWVLLTDLVLVQPNSIV